MTLSRKPLVRNIPPSEHQRRLYLHEFGHYIVSYALGLISGGVKIKIDVGQNNIQVNGASEVKLAQKGMDSLSNVRDYLQRRVTVLYAGACAESLKLDSGSLRVHEPDALTAPGAAVDFGRAMELIYFIRNQVYPNTESIQDIDIEVNKLDHCLWRATISIVEEQAAGIASLAEKYNHLINCHLPAASLEATDEVKGIVVRNYYDPLANL